jgi:hypothetical protein
MENIPPTKFSSLDQAFEEMAKNRLIVFGEYFPSPSVLNLELSVLEKTLERTTGVLHIVMG